MIESEQKNEGLTYQDFWNEIIPECEADIHDTTDYPQAIFYDKFSDLLIENNVFSGMDSHYFESHAMSKKYKMMKIDFGKVDPMENSINLLIIDYDPSRISTITNEKQNDFYNKMLNFVINCSKGYFKENGLQSDGIYPFVCDVIKALPETDNINLFVLSSNVRSNVLKAIEPSTIRIGEKDIIVSLKLIDIQYLFNSSLSTKHADPVNIVVKDINNGQISGIRCLPANIIDSEYNAYLAVLPGTFLSEIYRLYGGRLLENNVRAFLSTRGNVNKGIRNTIRTEPNKFFTYNNGIACTASSITTEQREDGIYITSLNDLQIINGGQTTASLRNAVLTDKDHIVDLNKVAVPMKLTVINETISDEDRQIMVSNISKYSNSQNKVSNSDMNSNSPFYIQFEKLSRRIYTPTMINGYQTMWFFERSRGQYERDQMELTPSKRKKFKEINPRKQLLRIIDIAKYYNSVAERPFKVVWGGQINAEDFQKTMQKLYEKDNNFVNDYFFKTIVGQAILFNRTREILRKTEEYRQHTDSLAAFVAYTISMLMHLVRQKKRDLDWRDIWTKQDLPDPLKAEIEKLGIWVVNALAEPTREKDSITEWGKQQKCWDGISKRTYTLSSETMEVLVSPEEAKADELSAKKESRANENVDVGIYIFNLGADYWQRFYDAGARHNKYSFDYDLAAAIKRAIESCERLKLIQETRIQTKLMKAKKEFEEEGIIEKVEPQSEIEED